jgi:hypothetical protein
MIIQKERVLFFGILALLSLLFFVILWLHYFSLLFPVLAGILGTILFIVIDGLSGSCPNGDVKIKQEGGQSKESSRILTILFLIFFALSFLTFFQGEYTKSVAYYLCIALCAGILILEIFTYRTRVQGYGILLKSVLLSLNIVFANHLIFVNGISLPDFGLHYGTFVRSILETGHISSSTIGYYNVFSLHHIFASENAIITGYDPLPVYQIFGSFILAIGVLFVFLIGKRFVNFRFGLVASVLFSCLDYYLMYGGHPEHQAYSFGFAVIGFTIILYTYRFQKPAFYVIFVLSAVGMFLSHHLTATLVFVTAFSLLIIDIWQTLQTRKFSLPSAVMVVVMSLLLVGALSAVSDNNPIQYANSVLSPYFMDTYTLLGNSFGALTPVSHILVTNAQGTSTQGTSTQGTSAQGTSTQGTSTQGIPVASVSVTPPYVPPTGYDKLPLLTLFENTLGSSLLVLVSVWGFCSCIKKRSWCGDFFVLNGILLSILLGLGILFSYVFLLPDRLYPTLQIFCLVFLGSYGILWLHNAAPSGKKVFAVGCICILVAMMSFFSLASIINGFETSPFVGDSVAYPKLYTTSQDVSFGTWSTSYILPVNQKDVVSEANDTGLVDIDTFTGNHYAVFDNSLLKTGFVKSGGKFGQETFTTIKNGQLTFGNSYSSYYDNGLITMINNYR